MNFEANLLGITFGTSLTLEWPFAGVNPQMDLHIALIRE
jgi:hypothetical protein